MHVEEWEWDDDNRAHLARHGVTRRIVEQVFETQPRFRANKPNRTGTHQMIGPAYSGTLYTICIVELYMREGLWRAITGWPASDKEKKWYEERQ